MHTLLINPSKIKKNNSNEDNLYDFIGCECERAIIKTEREKERAYFLSVYIV